MELLKNRFNILNGCVKNGLRFTRCLLCNMCDKRAELFVPCTLSIIAKPIVDKYGKHTLGSGGVHMHLEVHASLMQCMKLQRNFHRNNLKAFRDEKVEEIQLGAVAGHMMRL